MKRFSLRIPPRIMSQVRIKLFLLFLKKKKKSECALNDEISSIAGGAVQGSTHRRIGSERGTSRNGAES